MQKRRGEIGVCHYKKQWPAFYFFVCVCVGVCIEVCKCLCVYYMYAGAFCVYARENRKLINLRCCSSETTFHWTWSLLVRLNCLGIRPQGFSCLCFPRLLSTGTHLHPCFPGLRCACVLLWQACSHLNHLLIKPHMVFQSFPWSSLGCLLLQYSLYELQSGIQCFEGFLLVFPYNMFIYCPLITAPWPLPLSLSCVFLPSSYPPPSSLIVPFLLSVACNFVKNT